jgi:hypothetical protein
VIDRLGRGEVGAGDIQRALGHDIVGGSKGGSGDGEQAGSQGDQSAGAGEFGGGPWSSPVCSDTVPDEEMIKPAAARLRVTAITPAIFWDFPDFFDKACQPGD